MAEHAPVSTPFSEPDAAAYIGRRPSALRAWRMQGRGPSYIRYGRSIVYRREDLDTWLNAHRVHTRDTRGPEAA